MKLFLKILTAFIIILLISGLFMQSYNIPRAEMVIGITVLLIAFVLIPFFIYYRYRNKNLKDYMLTKENVDKIMQRLKK